MFVDEEKVIPFPRRPKAPGPEATGSATLRALREALAGASTTQADLASGRAANDCDAGGHQDIEGDWNLQLSSVPSPRQSIRGNHNVQIAGAQITLCVRMRR